MLDAIVISDLHLGSEVCQAKQLVHFLEQIKEELLVTSELILNGDVFDSWDFRRLKKNHWKVLSVIRSLSDHVKIVWITGNHDHPEDAATVAHLIGAEIVEQYVLESGGKSHSAVSRTYLRSVHFRSPDCHLDRRRAVQLAA